MSIHESESDVSAAERVAIEAAGPVARDEAQSALSRLATFLFSPPYSFQATLMQVSTVLEAAAEKVTDEGSRN